MQVMAIMRLATPFVLLFKGPKVERACSVLLPRLAIVSSSGIQYIVSRQAKQSKVEAKGRGTRAISPTGTCGEEEYS